MSKTKTLVTDDGRECCQRRRRGGMSVDDSENGQDPLNDLDEYFGRIRARLEAGRATYGDRSFSAAADVILDECEEETDDVPGWLFALWYQRQDLRGEIEAVCASAYSLRRRVRRLRSKI